MYTLAIDIGGTKIAAGIMDERQGWLKTLQNKSQTQDAMTMYNALVGTINDLIVKADLKPEDIDRMGITVPGQLDLNSGHAIYQKNLPWANFPLGDLLRKDFPEKVIYFEHDVVAAAHGEWSVRNLKDELFVYLTVSTGIAASIIYQGEVIRGTGLAGEVGLMPIENEKSLEDCAAGPAMEQDIKAKLKGLSLRDAFVKWLEGDGELNIFFNQKATQLAHGIFNIMATLDPHKIVLGGGVMNHQKQFVQLIIDKFSELCIHPFQKTWKDKIEPSKLKGESGLFGVAIKAQNYVFN